MVLLAGAAGLSSLMSSWPRMQSGQKNPFQNAPGPFIYALPNLAVGTCPLSCSSDTLLFCSFPGDSNAPSASDPHHHHHHDRCCHHSPAPAEETSRCSDSCCHYDPPSGAESAELELPTALTKEGAPNTEPQPPPLPPSAPSLSPSDECHFGLGDLISLSPLTEGETEAEQQQQQQQQQQEQEPQASAPPTPTRSNAPSSPTGSDFQEGSESKKEDGGEGEGDGKGDGKRNKARGRRGRRRNRKQAKGRSQAERGPNSIAPRFMGVSGIHYGLWAQYVCPQAPAPLPAYAPPPPAMNYHHHYGGFVVPPNNVTSSPAPAPLFWNPMVPATGFVAVPVA